MNTTAVLIMVLVFLVLLLLNVPIAVSIGLSTLFAFMATPEQPVALVAPKLANGINSFALLAIPFFILMGLFMGRGGIARRLIDFAEALLGWLPGGLAFSNILACMFFGAISGSAVAAVSSIGGVLMPEMERKGYDKNFNIALSCCAGTLGLVIPPSNIMIIYAWIAEGTSVKDLFLAGFLPGILIGTLLMVVSGVISYRNDYGEITHTSFTETLWRGLKALPGLLMILIVLGGVIMGYFTATEAAAIAVIYSFVLSVLIYREVKWRDIPEILLQCGVTTAVVMFLIGASMGMKEFITLQSIPAVLGNLITSISSSWLVIMLLINVMLLIVGTFLDMTPALLIFTPVLLPIVSQLGVDVTHFGIIMIVNLCIGLCTPPVGTVMFVGVAVGNGTISEVVERMIPFFAILIIALLLITYIPSISMFLPNLF